MIAMLEDLQLIMTVLADFYQAHGYRIIINGAAHYEVRHLGAFLGVFDTKGQAVKHILESMVCTRREQD